MEVLTSCLTQSIPCEKKSRPSGSTSHHLPWYFSALKNPAASNFGFRTPASIFVPAFRLRVFSKFLRFRITPFREVGNRHYFSRPVPVLVLSVSIDERKVRRCIRHARSRRRINAGGADVPDLDLVVGIRHFHKNDERRDLRGGIEDRLPLPPVWPGNLACQKASPRDCRLRGSVLLPACLFSREPGRSSRSRSFSCHQPPHYPHDSRPASPMPTFFTFSATS